MPIAINLDWGDEAQQPRPMNSSPLPFQPEALLKQRVQEWCQKWLPSGGDVLPNMTSVGCS